MTQDEAAEILGVTLAVDAGSLRRAYLKQVKQHRPERDPDGFQRVRAAYDLLRSRGKAPLSGGPLDPTPVERQTQDVQPGNGDTVFGRPVDELDAVNDAYASLDALDEAEARLTLARRTHHAYPDSPDASWLLYEVLREEARDDEAIALLRAASARGMPGFFDVLVANHRHALSDAELEAAATTPQGCLTVALVHMDRDDPESALQHALSALEEASRSQSDIALNTVLVLVFGFFAREHTRNARELFARFRSFLDESGLERRLRGGHAILYLLSSELDAVAEDVPPDVCAVLAEGVLARNLSRAPAILAHRFSDPALKDAREALRVRAPNLWRTAETGRGETEFEPSPDEPTAEARESVWGQVGLSMLGILVVSCVSFMWSSPRTRPDTVERLLPDAPPLSVTELQRTTERICTTAEPVDLEEACSAASAFVAAYQTERCDDALTAYSRLVGLPEASRPASEEARDTLDRARRWACRARANGRPR